MSELTRRLQQADPGLNVIAAGKRTSRKKGSRPIQPDAHTTGNRLNGKDWDDAGGWFCPKCGGEAVRTMNGVCLDCYTLEVKDKAKVENMLGRMRDQGLISTSRLNHYMAKYGLCAL